MKPFHMVAIPHRDILEGKLTMDIFAADLWETYYGRGPAEYRDPELFFQKTYLTEGLKNLLNVVKKRIDGVSGDSTIQIQTPFGGGKTHSLIALLHKARNEWKANVVVIVGTALDAKENTLWGILERQLTGKEEHLRGQTAPGKDKLKNILSQYQPLIILMDEVLEYITKAAGVKVGDSTLSAQSLAFMQELTEAVATLGRTCLVVTLPSSTMEHYDEEAERLFNRLQKIVGRTERVYTPVQDHEIAKVVRSRLFSSVDEKEAKETVSKFLDYAQKEGLLPIGVEPTEYRDRFLDSYPFLPDVIDALYHRWGSIPNFQRTRGVLRLLSLVVHSLKESNIPYISLGDFDLRNQDLRQELVKHIGSEFNSVIAQDITDFDSGSKKVDISLGDSYKGLNLGTRSATTIFMYSFSGGTEKGASILEIKRNATTLNNPSSVIVEVLDYLEEKLFYLQKAGDKYYFTNEPNLNRVLVLKMENIDDRNIEAYEKKLIEDNFKAKGGRFRVYIWEENSWDIPDEEEFKLIVLKETNRSKLDEIMKNMVKNKGKNPRVYGNTLFFIYSGEPEKVALQNEIKKYLAYKLISEDKNISLRDEQKKEIQNKLKEIQTSLKEKLYRAYRFIGIPDRDEIEIIDLGVPAFGSTRTLDERVYERLKAENKILEKITPIYFVEKYLKEKDYVNTKNLYNSFFITPGEDRIESRKTFEDCIKEGVKGKIFGLGYLEDGEIKCRYFGEEPKVNLDDNEIIIKREICEKLKEKEKEEVGKPAIGDRGGNIGTIIKEEEVKGESDTKAVDQTPTKVREKIRLKIKFSTRIPNARDLAALINCIAGKFADIEIIIKAENGKITEDEYVNKIKEDLNQMGVEYEEES